MDLAPGAYIYHGVWINWSHGKVLGSTITLSARNGALLTAFLAIFVSAAGAALWRILAFVVHQLRASPGSQDGLHHQQQVVLRNVGTPGAASWQLIQMLYAWWRHAKRPFRRSLPLVLLALANLAAFAVAGVFSSEVTKAAGDVVLLRSDDCGYWDLNTTYALMRKSLNDTITAASYARTCYGSESNAKICNQYAKPQLAYTTDRNATCPVTLDLCLKATPAFSLDTGNLSSHDDLGINTHKKHRISYRRKTVCSPIKDKGYVIALNFTQAVNTSFADIVSDPDDIVDFYMFGPTGYGPLDSFTYFYNRRIAKLSFDYNLFSISYYSGDGSNNTWTPVDALSRDNADVSLVFLSANAINYPEPVYDPIFTATTEFPHQNQTTYTSDYYVNPLVCTNQHQFCNQNNQRCTALDSYKTAVRAAWANLELSAVQSVIVSLLLPELFFASISESIGHRGAAALRARELVYSVTSAPLPSDQWTIEVESWFATSLAKLQAAVVSHATGPSNVGDGAYVTKLQGPLEQMLCDNQRVRSTANITNFATAGVVIILVMGGLLIIGNFFLDTIVGYIQRKWSIRDYQRIHWVMQDKLQLQRQVYEEAGMGTWVDGAFDVPVTKYQEKFGMPRAVGSNDPSSTACPIPGGPPKRSSKDKNENKDDGSEADRLIERQDASVELTDVLPGIQDEFARIITRYSQS